jgi:tripartite-type tricarboxylate transporter receptor subunit TctC
VAAWNKGLTKVMALPDVKDKLFAMGFLPVGKPVEELVARNAASVKRWEPVIKASGFTAD